VNKVLHVIENFNGQAIERWLYQMMRYFTEVDERVEWTFYSILGKSGKMDDTVRELGGKIIYSPVPLQNKARFLKALRETIARGSYDILHSHHDIMSAVYLLASAGLPLKKRIVHVHNTTLCLPTPSVLKNALLHEPMRRACLHWSDHIVGVSDAALDAFLKGEKHKLGRDLVIHCGINMVPFHRKSMGRPEFLQSLGLPIDSKILLFVGRMNEYKNPLFVIDVLELLVRRDSAFCALFAGSGPLVDAVRRKAEQKFLGSRVRVMGWQEDVPALMQSSDVLIWPGLEYSKEGLGLAVVEAQAAGLPIVMSHSVPWEAIVVPELVVRLPLASGSHTWSDAVRKILFRTMTSRQDSLTKVASSSFELSKSASNILKLYH
jgi:glycosyltransferase EpsF